MKASKKVSRKTDDPLAGDLSDLLENGDWKRVKFELRPKNKTITIRLSEELLEAIKGKAEANGLDYQKWIRIALERLVDKAG